MVDIEKLERERYQLITEMKSITTEAQKRENKRMTEQEAERWQELNVRVDELKEEIERGKRMNELEMENAPEPEEERNAGGGQESRMGLGEFLQNVAFHYMPDKRASKRFYEERATGMSEGVPSDGGFLVGTDHAAELFKRTYELGILSNRVRKIPITANSNRLTMNAVDESDRSTGSRWGGVQGYWLEEAGTKTASKPKFRRMELSLKKLIGVYYSTDELLDDVAALESIVSPAFAEEFSWLIDDGIYRGPGGGRMLGILNSPALVTVSPETGQAADTIVYENIVNMWSRMWGRSRQNAIWVYDQSIEPQLYTMSLAVGTGGIPVYMPAGGASASPYGSLMGRPCIPLEQASALGTVGDIGLIDPSQYLMIDKGGMQYASSIHVQFLTDETCFRFVMRVDGMPMWNSVLTPASSGPTLSPFVVLDDR